MKRLSFFFAAILFLTSCGRLDSIPYSPPQTPETWLQIQPYVEFKLGSQNVVFVQPSTSIIVYLLGVITIVVGVYFLKIQNGQRSRFWWGIALLLWGLGALLAGTSYEAFSYAIKCAGRDACLWTSWWEVTYLILSVWSIDAMVLAVAHSSADGRFRRWLSVYAVINAILYFFVVMIGAFIPVKFLISFELLLVVSAPGILALFILNGWRYSRYKERLDLAYLGTWIWLGITIAAYFLYLISGITASLWAKGFWFSENDVLHVGLIIWMIFIARILAPRVKDLTE